jgi:hypothetical protein
MREASAPSADRGRTGIAEGRRREGTGEAMCWKTMAVVDADGGTVHGVNFALWASATAAATVAFRAAAHWPHGAAE